MKIEQNRSKRKRIKKKELLELVAADRKYIEALEEKLSASEIEACKGGIDCAVCEDPEALRSAYRNREQTKKILFHMFYAFLVTAAIAVLVSNYIISIVDVYGSAMAPALYAGDTVVCLKNTTYDTGDVVAFYYNNDLQIKRVIAKAGDWVNLDEEGRVYLNGAELDEPYLFEQALGTCDIDLPYQVPDGCVFVLGDNRGISIDSRCTEIGAIEEERILGKLIFKIWPFPDAGLVH